MRSADGRKKARRHRCRRAILHSLSHRVQQHMAERPECYRSAIEWALHACTQGNRTQPLVDGTLSSRGAAACALGAGGAAAA